MPIMNMSLADHFASLPDDCIGLVLGFCDIVKDFRLVELLPQNCDSRKTTDQWKKNGQIIKKTDTVQYTSRCKATNTVYVTKNSMTNQKTRTNSFHSIDDTPAVKQVLDNGIVVLEEYYTAGKYYRRDINRPVSIKRSVKGLIIKEKFLIGTSEEFIRNGPSAADNIQLLVKTYTVKGDLATTEYYMNDKYHRLDGPAVIHYDRSVITRIGYYEYGVRHRNAGQMSLYMDERLSAYKSWLENQPTKRKPKSIKTTVAKKRKPNVVPMEVDGEVECKYETVADETIYPDFGYDLEHITADEKDNAELPAVVFFLNGRPIKQQFFKEGFPFRMDRSKPIEIEFENDVKIAEKFVTAYQSSRVFSRTQTLTIEYRAGQKVREWHRMGDMKYALNAETPIETRYRNGVVIYREFKPSVVQSKPVAYEYYETGELKTEVYTDPDNPRLVSNTQPTVIHYHRNGVKKQIIYQVMGFIHRDGAPAVINYHESGLMHKSLYYYRGSIHNNKFPAYQEWRPDGTRLKCAYFENGRLVQNPNKISHMRYDEKGICNQKCSYSNGSLRIYLPDTTADPTKPPPFKYTETVAIPITNLVNEFTIDFTVYYKRPEII